MPTDENIDRTFVKGGNVTLVVGAGQRQKRLLVNARRMIEVSPMLGRAITESSQHDPNHHLVLVRKPKKDHTQLFMLAANPEAWMLLCAIIYPQSGFSVHEIRGAHKLEAAGYAIIYDMKATISRDWPRFTGIPVLDGEDMWISMNAVFLLEIPKEFDVLSREIIYGYKDSLLDLVPGSHDAEWGNRVAVAMDDVRDRVRCSIMRIVGIASTICTEPGRFPSCDNPEKLCFHTKALRQEIWQNESNRSIYENMASYTPNQLREFWTSLPWLGQWLSNASNSSIPHHPGKPQAQKEAEIFSRKWNSVKGPLGICLYCDAHEPALQTKCQQSFCRSKYGELLEQTFGG